jgi:hypothetical protein
VIEPVAGLPFASETVTFRVVVLSAAGVRVVPPSTAVFATIVERVAVIEPFPAAAESVCVYAAETSPESRTPFAFTSRKAV